jgi:mannose-6-phosphate isomerase-like protein (cupin superfamily)
MSAIVEAMRRIITADDAGGRSFVLIDGAPSADAGSIDTGGLYEIWHEIASGPIDPRETSDRGPQRARLSPDPDKVRVRWFVVPPLPENASRDELNAAVRARFELYDAADHLTDQSRHPAMHRTASIDIICLLKGEAQLVLDNEEVPIREGQVVIQRGTSHAWRAIGGPALFLAVLIDRPFPAGRP